MDLTARVCTGLAATGLVLAVTTWQPPRSHPSTIGGTPIPAGLRCSEDSAVFFTGPDTLACVHVEGNVLGQ